MRFEDLRVGQRAELRRTVTDADIVLFAGLTGDLNPVHVDDVAAAASRFGGRIAHGMLPAGYISAVLGTQLPGPGTIYLGQTLRFTAPVRIGDTVRAQVEVTSLDDKRRRVQLATRCFRQDGEQILEGEALVWLPAEATPAAAAPGQDEPKTDRVPGAPR